MSTRSHEDWRTFPTDLADRCVKCAQCLPHCPTWALSHDEAESPRGRIALMTARAESRVPADSGILRHIDQCIGCGHCESVCPAEVPFRALADAAQRATHGAARAPLRARLLRHAIRWPRLFRYGAVPTLRAWLRRRPAPRDGVHPPTGVANGETVMLFLGCVARAIDGATLTGALRALRDAGYAVVVPPGQHCCGALHRHAGEVETADTLADANAHAFTGTGAVVSCASGCAVTLREHPALGARVVDVSTMLARSAEPRAVAADVVVHTPCTLRGSEASAPRTLLPGARALPSLGRCCGAGGEYMLRQPEIAARLRDQVLDELGDGSTLCTSNPGCAEHLRAGIAARGSTAVVRHPVLEWLGD